MPDWLKSLLGIGGAVGGGLLTAEAYKRLSDIGEQSLAGTTFKDPVTEETIRIPGAVGLAQEAVEMSQFKPFTVTSTLGGGFTAKPQFDEEGAFTGISTGMTLSEQEAAIQNAMLTQAQTELAATPYGQQMGRTAAEQAFGLGGQMMTGLTDTSRAQRESDIYGRIRAAQSPEEQRQAQQLEERLAAQGRLGVQTAQYGGTPEQLAFGKAQAEARNTAMLQAMGQAQAEQAQMAQQAQMFTGMGSQLSVQDLMQRAGQQQLGLGALGAAYIPQTQMMQLQQAMMPYQRMQQEGQLFGAGQYGETMMSGLDARLIAEQARANLLGSLGTGLLGGLLNPAKSDDGYVIPFLDLLGVS
jgi:hypothetical protein